MPVQWDEEAPRLARLARLQLAPDEAGTLAAACESITAQFAALADFAHGLPDAPAATPAPLRDDVANPAPDAEVEAILLAVPKLDSATRLVVVPRGLP